MRSKFIKTFHEVAHLARKVSSEVFRKKWKKSYSQCGEDIILDLLLTGMGITKPTYLDVGAHDPKLLNNTYLFYTKGCSGICVEPSPTRYKRLARTRKRDVCLNVGVGISNETAADFYMFDPDTLSTFSKDTAEDYITKQGARLVRTIKVPLLTINKILEDHFTSSPNLISIDTEGTECELLATFDFVRYRPEMFCVETVPYLLERITTKSSDTFELMKMNDYFLYADTWINSIFIDRRAWGK